MPPQYPSYGPQPTPTPPPAGPQPPVQPQSVYPPGIARPVSPNDYEFILNPASQKRSGGFHLGSGKSRNLFLVIAVLVLLLIGVGLYGVLSGGGDDNVALFTKTAQQQTEIIRVANLALAQDGVAQSTQNAAMTALLTVSSDRSATVDYLSKNGTKLKEEQLALGKVAATTETLTTAASSGGYDETYLKVLQQQLSDYQTTLKQAFQATSGPNGQAVLNSAFNNAELLLKQSQQR